MAEETTRIIRIEIDPTVIDQSKKRAVELSNSIAKLRGELKANTRETDDMNEAYIEQTAQLKALDKEYKQNIEVLKQANTITATSEGSNAKLRAQLSLLTNQYNGLSKSERENSDVGQRLKTTIRSISDELKVNEGAIGDNRRNVGNYKEAFGSLVSVLGSAGGTLGNVTNAASGLNTAFKANPFIAVLSILIPLIQQFLKLDSVAEAIEGVMNGVNAAFKVTIGAISDFIGALISGKGIFAAFSDSFDNLGGRISEAAKQTYNLTQATKQLEDARRSQIVLNAKDEAQIKNLIIQSKDRTKTVQDRLELLYKASRIEQNNFEEQVRIAKEEERIAKQKLALADKNADNIDELKQKAAEAEAAVIQLQSSSADLQEKIINRKNALLDAEQEQIDKALEKKQAAIEKENELREKELEKRKQLEDAGDKYAEQKSKEFTAKLKAEQDKRKQDKIEAFNSEMELIGKRGELENLIAENSITDAKQLEAEKRRIALETLQIQLQALRAYFSESGVITEAQSLQLRNLEEQIKKIQNVISTPPQGKVTLGDSIGLSPKEIGEIQVAISTIQASISGLSDVINAGYQVRLEEIEGVKNAEIQAIQNSTATEEEKKVRIAAANKKFAKEQYEIQRKQFEVNKAVQIVQTIANTAAAIVAQFANPTPYAGAILAALAAATGAAQIAVISAQQPPSPPSFARGTFLKDGQGTETSDSIPAYLSKNETVINAKSSKRFLPLLSKINEWGGGVAFANRGGSYDYLVNRFAGGGIPTQISNSAFQSQEASQQVANQINTIVPVLVLEEFQAVQGRQIRTATNLEL